MKTRFYGTLARRIFYICLVLVIIPLILYSFLLWERDWRIKLNAVFSELELAGDAAEEIITQWTEWRGAQLQTAYDYPGSLSGFKKTGHFSLLLGFKGDRCIASSDPDLIGREDLLPNGVREKKKLLFYGPSASEYSLYEQIGEEKWGISAPSPSFTLLEPFMVRVVPKEIAEGFSREQLVKMKETAGFIESYRLKGKDLKVLVSVKDSLFDLEVVIPYKEVQKYEGVNILTHSVAILFIFLCVGGVGTIWLMLRMEKAYENLYTTMHAAQGKDYSQRYHKDAFGFEINILGSQLNHLLETVVAHIKTIKKEQLAKELLANELRIGHEIQKQLFPREIPLSSGRGFIPAKEVAGDFYDIFSLGDDRFFFTVADGSDKGISACLFSLIARTLLRSYVFEGKELGEVLQLTNGLLCKDTKDSGDFVTAWLAIYDKRTRQLSYASAGHPAALLIHPNGEIEELHAKGIALGVTESAHFELHSRTFPSGGMLFLYSDGVVDAHNKKGELFGKSRLIHYLRSARNLSPQQIVDQLLKEINDYSEEELQSDDITILCLHL